MTDLESGQVLTLQLKGQKGLLGKQYKLGLSTTIHPSIQSEDGVHLEVLWQMVAVPLVLLSCRTSGWLQSVRTGSSSFDLPLFALDLLPLPPMQCIAPICNFLYLQ